VNGAGRRSKGAAGERELFKLLSNELGISVTRNLEQSRRGGSDTIDVPGWSIECKRQERANLTAWWAQTFEQSKRDGKRPALFYRANRQPWMVMLDMHDVAVGLGFARGSEVVIVSFAAACQVIREYMEPVFPQAPDPSVIAS